MECRGTFHYMFHEKHAMMYLMKALFKDISQNSVKNSMGFRKMLWHTTEFPEKIMTHAECHGIP